MGGSKKDPDPKSDSSFDNRDDGECSTESEKYRRGHSRSPKRRGGKPSRSRSRSPIRSRRSRSRSVERRHTSSRAPRRPRSRSPSPMTPPYRRDRPPFDDERRPYVLNREEPEPSRCLGVFGMSLYTTERDLTDFFARFGKIESVTVIYDHDTQTSRGFGFINFERLKDAIEARNEAAGAEIDGVSVRVDFSLTKRPHAPTPGIYMGSRPRSHGYGGDRGGRFHRGGDYRGGDYRDGGYRGANRSRGHRYWNNGDGYGGGDHRGRRSASPYGNGDRHRRSRSVERDCY